VNRGIAEQRLHNQYVTRARRRRPADIVAWLGAVQAQEYPFARWGLALRMPEGTIDADIERECDEGRILRTHVMRPTWHFVTPSDIRWMLELTAPHVHRTMGHYNRRLDLDPRTLTRGTSVIERALRDGNYLTRPELGLRLERAGLAPMKGQRLAHATMHAELEGVICSGPRRDKKLTYALVAERAPSARRLPRDEALAELTRRFFTSHGPATIRDFVWWSGLRTADAKRGLEINRARQEMIDGLVYWTLGRAQRAAPRGDGVHLLPVYDEYLIAYRDREAVPHGPSLAKAPAASVMFVHPLVIAGQVAGMWRTAAASSQVLLSVAPLRRLTKAERAALAEAAARYGRFLGVPLSLSVA